jgi:hypothetical protein
MSSLQLADLPGASDQDRSPYPPGWLVGQLPVGMRDDDLLVRLTTIFERVGGTLRAGADATELVADHRVTSAAMLQYLSTWTGLEVLDPELPVLRQRAVVRAISRSVPRRGTVGPCGCCSRRSPRRPSTSSSRAACSGRVRSRRMTVGSRSVCAGPDTSAARNSSTWSAMRFLRTSDSGSWCCPQATTTPRMTRRRSCRERRTLAGRT